MNKIEKIRAKIERRINELDKDKYINIDAKACRVSELSSLKRFLDTLSEEPDKSLEEAARHSEILTYPMPDDGDIEKVMKVQEARIFHEIGFKAGAEWQKEQMTKEDQI